MEGIEPRIHEDRVARKGDNSLHHYNLVHKFIPMRQGMKIPTAKEAVDKEWGKLKKISAWNLAKVRNKSEVIEEARTQRCESTFRIIDGLLSSEEFRIREETPDV